MPPETSHRRLWRGSRFYAVLTFSAWLVTGLASLRWPGSALAGGFQSMSLLLAIMLREAMARSQDYFTRRQNERKAEDKDGNYSFNSLEPESHIDREN